MPHTASATNVQLAMQNDTPDGVDAAHEEVDEADPEGFADEAEVRKEDAVRRFSRGEFFYGSHSGWLGGPGGGGAEAGRSGGSGSHVLAADWLGAGAAGAAAAGAGSPAGSVAGSVSGSTRGYARRSVARAMLGSAGGSGSGSVAGFTAGSVSGYVAGSTFESAGGSGSAAWSVGDSADRDMVPGAVAAEAGAALRAGLAGAPEGGSDPSLRGLADSGGLVGRGNS